MARPDKRQMIMQAVERLLRHRHLHQITLDEVAQKARVGKGTLYLHFKDKEDLFFQTAISSFEQLRLVVEEQDDCNCTFEERLTDACKRVVGFFEDHFALMRMIQMEESRLARDKGRLKQEWLMKRKDLLNAFTSILKQGIREGKVREDIPPDVLSFYLLSMLRARVRDLADAPQQHRDVSKLVDLFVSGTSPRIAEKIQA